MLSARRGPICAETNPCFRLTPGTWGMSDPSDVNDPVIIPYSPVCGLGVFASPNSGGSKSVATHAAKVKPFLDQMKKDLKAIGLTLAGADLLDLRAHAQYDKLKIFNAWTNSATEIYVNVDAAPALAQQLSQFSSVTDSTRMAALAYSTILVRHEIHHVKQFKSHGGHPATYKEMCIFERDAYKDDAAWTDTNQDKMKKLGMTDEVIDAFRASQLEAARTFEEIADLKTESERKAAMIQKDFLPPHDKINELYKAR